MCRNKIIAAAVCCLAVFCIGSNVVAFEYAGQAWCCDTIEYYVNPTDPSSSCGLPVGPGWFQPVIDKAASAWNNLGTQFQLIDSGTTQVACTTSGIWPGVCHGIKDGQNTISMATNCGWTDPSVIAFSTWWFYVSGDTNRCIYESDICFNDDVTWFNDSGGCGGSCYDLVSVAEHEIGHWIASNHENDDVILGYKPIMYFSYFFCEIRRVVTQDDSALINWAYDANGSIALPQRAVVAHEHPPYPTPPPHDSCSQQPCPPGQIFCDSLRALDPCLLICPASDIVYTVIAMDSCGNPVCDLTGMWLDFSSCPAIPCPGEEPDWPKVFPDSCNPATGAHYFTVDAGLQTCVDCTAQLIAGGSICFDVPTRWLDNDGDLCVTDFDYVGTRVCDDLNCDGIGDSTDSLVHAAHLGHCCSAPPCPPGPPFCDSVTFDPCLLACPLSDIVYTVTVKDSCGNPICDTLGTFLQFNLATCPVQPCPGEEPDWPTVFPDSCDPVTGTHYFTVDAGMLALCNDCQVEIYVDSAACAIIPARFVDNDGDLCVTQADWVNQLPCNDYNCDGVVDAADNAIHAAHLGHCCGTPPCPPGPPFCDSVITDPCLVICPLSDIVWTAIVKDSCGNPICDMAGTWLDFSGCNAQPCPGEEPNWPLVFPDSCDPLTGTHYFTVDAGQTDCVLCDAQLFVNGQFCRLIPARFLDIDGDLCVTQADWGTPPFPCNDYDCDGAFGTPADAAFFAAHLGHCCPPPCGGGVPSKPFCDSVTTDPCLVICPLSDIVWSATILDSCGIPICDTLGTWLDFSGCNAQPCPGEEPFWPLVFPDSCDPVTGKHYFTVDAGHMLGAVPCPDCQPILFVDGLPCKTVTARFLDLDGDLCVTPVDWLGSFPCNDYNCDGVVDAVDNAIHVAHLGHCCPEPCGGGLIGKPFCDSVVTDSCLVVCPASDILFAVLLKDSCGNVVCDSAGTWLQFDTTICPAIPCPNEEPDWPKIFSDTCDLVRGTIFIIDGGQLNCTECTIDLYVDSQYCRTLPVRFLDTNGDLCVDSTDMVIGGPLCNDYNCDGIVDANDWAVFDQHYGHCCNASGSIQGIKFNDEDCDGVFDAGEPTLANWQIDLYQGPILIASTVTGAGGQYSFPGLCAGSYIITEHVQGGWVQTFPHSVYHTATLTCGQVVQGLDFGNRDTTCAGVLLTTGQLDGTNDNYAGAEASSPGADLIPLLNCPNGMNNNFDSPITNQCFGHTFDSLWDTTCCIVDAQLCLRVRATGQIPSTDALIFAEDGATIWAISMNALQTIVTGGADSTWDLDDTMNVCLDLDSLPADAHGITNVLAALHDGDFDVKIQDDTEVDYLEIRVTLCCGDCCTPTPMGGIQGTKFDDQNCNGVQDGNEPPLANWVISLYQGQTLLATTTTNAVGQYFFNDLCPGTYVVTEQVQNGWVQTYPPTAIYVVDVVCGATQIGLDFGNRDTTCTGVLLSQFRLDGDNDNYAGSQASSPGTDLLPLLNCPNGMNNNFDSPMNDRCFGHTFNHFWNTDCCIMDGQLCLRVRASGGDPQTDYIYLAENGIHVWALSMNDLQSFATGGSDNTWSAGDTMNICLDLDDLPPDGHGVTNVLAILGDGDFDVKFQDDTEIDYLDLHVTLCCPGCCIGMRGDVNGDGANIDIVDLTCMVDFLFGTGCVMPCFEEADVNGDGFIDIVDLTCIVDYLFGNPGPNCPAPCP